MTQVIKSAFLRVYLPEDQIRAWETHRESPEPRTRRWDPYGFVGESMIEDAWVADWNGTRYVCPRRPQLRMLEGVLALYNTFDTVGRTVIIPEEVARQADRELRKLKASEPDIRSQILTSAWHVPVRWFAAFAPEEREYLAANGERSNIRYRTKVHAAKARIEEACATMVKARLPATLVSEVANLADWLNDFPSSSMVELDYGTVAELFTEDDLVLDESAADVKASLQALAAGDPEEAGRHYSYLLSRWSPAFSLTFSN